MENCGLRNLQRLASGPLLPLHASSRHRGAGLAGARAADSGLLRHLPAHCWQLHAHLLGLSARQRLWLGAARHAVVPCRLRDSAHHLRLRPPAALGDAGHVWHHGLDGRRARGRHLPGRGAGGRVAHRGRWVGLLGGRGNIRYGACDAAQPLCYPLLALQRAAAAPWLICPRSQEWPNPACSEGVFGFHEIFHVFVLLGAGLHYAFMWIYVVPYNPRSER